MDVALRKESVDRNRLVHVLECSIRLSLSARRAWIEMRNIWYNSHDGSVALRKESVDRNIRISLKFDLPLVALRKESVDRNMRQVVHIHAQIPSLSARRAWIEIRKYLFLEAVSMVALRKESVDRNLPYQWGVWTTARSLSARRAWIEISVAQTYVYAAGSLSARRAWIEIRAHALSVTGSECRSPQGERG